jgi:hypothetical protein
MGYTNYAGHKLVHFVWDGTKGTHNLVNGLVLASGATTPSVCARGYVSPLVARPASCVQGCKREFGGLACNPCRKGGPCWLPLAGLWAPALHTRLYPKDSVAPTGERARPLCHPNHKVDFASTLFTWNLTMHNLCENHGIHALVEPF